MVCEHGSRAWGAAFVGPSALGRLPLDPWLLRMRRSEAWASPDDRRANVTAVLGSRMNGCVFGILYTLAMTRMRCIWEGQPGRGLLRPGPRDQCLKICAAEGSAGLAEIVRPHPCPRSPDTQASRSGMPASGSQLDTV